MTEKSTGVDVEIDSVTKGFQGKRVLNSVSLRVARGEFFTLLGPSGCGKTTILRAIAGFVGIDSGSIRFNGAEITHVQPWRRNIGFVFQNYALWPNRTVFENVAFGLRLRKLPNDTVRKKVTEILSLVELSGVEQLSPGELSGGMQQRTAIARALVIEPTLLLLDEPLSNLDARLRVNLRREIQAIQKRLSVTTIYVTHDQEEALEISDRIAVMHEGRVQQIGTSEQIYSEPKTRFVAEFVGSANLIYGVFSDGLFAAKNGASFSWSEAEKRGWHGAGYICIRPEDFRLVSNQDNQQFEGVVTKCYYTGTHRRYELTGMVPGQLLVFTTRKSLSLRQKVRLSIERAVWLPADELFPDREQENIRDARQ